MDYEDDIDVGVNEYVESKNETNNFISTVITSGSAGQIIYGHTMHSSWSLDTTSECTTEMKGTINLKNENSAGKHNENKLIIEESTPMEFKSDTQVNNIYFNYKENNKNDLGDVSGGFDSTHQGLRPPPSNNNIDINRSISDSAYECDYNNLISENDIPTTLEEVVIESNDQQNIVSNAISNKSVFRIRRISSKNPRSLLKKKFVCVIDKPSYPQQQLLITNNDKTLQIIPILKLPDQQMSPLTSSSIPQTLTSLSSSSSSTTLSKSKSDSNILEQQNFTEQNKTNSKFKESFKLTHKINNDNLSNNSPKNYYSNATNININRKKSNNRVINNTKLKSITKNFKQRIKYGKNYLQTDTDRIRENTKTKKRKKFVDLHGANITINHENDNIMPSNGNEIINVSSINGNSDDSNHSEDIDIMNDEEDNDNIKLPSDIKNVIVTETIANNVDTTDVQLNSQTLENTITRNDDINLLNYSPELRTILHSIDEPIEEYQINCLEISEIERYFLYEFFEGRLAKTPERYQTIRQYILNTWQDMKPAYVSKTTVRTGLKQCGDVNCISRVHLLLEQLGAINFGHANEQFKYVRPLININEILSQSKRTKLQLDNNCIMEKRRHQPRNFIQKSTENSTNQTKSLPTTSAKKNSKFESELINCQKYITNELAPFTVSITLSTLLCLQLHSLSSKYEIMGFLGGHYDNVIASNTIRNVDRRTKLSITRYKPCRTLLQTSTNCEMCPISQLDQTTKLVNEGYDLLGWFHSHPTFPPIPSPIDIRTQQSMQLYFCNGEQRPFIGFILSCLNFTYKCIHINQSKNDDQTINVDCVPFEIPIEIIKDCTNVDNEIIDVFDVIERNDEKQFLITLNKFKTAAQPLLQEYGYDEHILSFLEKYSL